MKCSIIIPAYNEERRIGLTLDDYITFFSRFPQKNVEIIIVLNGCTDNTLNIVQSFAKRSPIIRYLNIPQAIGKGGAIIEGFKTSKGDLVGFADADGATRAEHFARLITSLGKADGIIASRWIPCAVMKPPQPLSRRIASRCFNVLVRILFGLPFHDTQCGCKLFKRTAILQILPSLQTTRWAFDVDLLYHLKRRGFHVKEVPTVW